MKALLKTLTAAALVFSFASTPASLADLPKGEASSPRLLVHLLDYVGMDYPGAVSNGKVLSATEYQEQKEFVASAREMAGALPETRDDAEVKNLIADLEKVVNSKGSADDVSRLALRIKNRVLLLGKVQVAPKNWPNLKRGRELFAANCTSCHGATGAGDGPAAASLDPKPANFLDPQKGADLSPFRAFNTVRVGIPGTPMVPVPLSDEDTWDLAFFTVSLRHQAAIAAGQALPAPKDLSPQALSLVASKSDNELKTELKGPSYDTDDEKAAAILAWRVHSDEGPRGGGGGGTLDIARQLLNSSLTSYRAGDKGQAKSQALLAYLEGIEPAEPKLKANDAAFTSSLEEKMAYVRSKIEAGAPVGELETAVSEALSAVDRAQQLLSQEKSSAWLTFVMTSGILLREGFEAVLILIALLAVVRASSAKKAERYIHLGWVGALLLGWVAWFFSGWLMKMSGADREMLEGVISLFAVFVLLYIGFWLHSRTEIHRWKIFIEGRVKTTLEGKSLYGLAAISFVAVFREAFETVLFLRAIALEGGAGDQTRPMALGVAVSLGGIFVMAWALLKYSAKLPIRKLFTISSSLMALLAVILTGKGLHALQETGTLGVTHLPFRLRSEFLGLFPTRETLVPQLGVVVVLGILWMIGRRPPAAGNA